MRPDWDNYFLTIAWAVSRRATCSRLSVGAVLVDAEHRIIATGYNGAPRGERHCNHTFYSFCSAHIERDPNCNTCPHGSVGDMYFNPETQRYHCRLARHAEDNIWEHVRGFGPIEEATLYLTHTPCLNCTRNMLKGNKERPIRLTRVVYAQGYTPAQEVELAFDAARVKLELVDVPCPF